MNKIEEALQIVEGGMTPGNRLSFVELYDAALLIADAYRKERYPMRKAARFVGKMAGFILLLSISLAACGGLLLAIRLAFFSVAGK